MLNAWNKYNNIYEALKPEIPFKLTKPIVFHLNQNMFKKKKKNHHYCIMYNDNLFYTH